MRGTQGALIVASTLQIVLGFSGLWRNVVRLSQFCFISINDPASHIIIYMAVYVSRYLQLVEIS